MLANFAVVLRNIMVSRTLKVRVTNSVFRYGFEWLCGTKQRVLKPHRHGKFNTKVTLTKCFAFSKRTACELTIFAQHLQDRAIAILAEDHIHSLEHMCVFVL